jgi:hypothetical protein
VKEEVPAEGVGDEGQGGMRKQTEVQAPVPVKERLSVISYMQMRLSAAVYSQ